jgi:hypothetical protein
VLTVLTIMHATTKCVDTRAPALPPRARSDRLATVPETSSMHRPRSHLTAAFRSLREFDRLHGGGQRHARSPAGSSSAAPPGVASRISHASMVSQIVSLNAAVATLNRARQQSPALDARLAPLRSSSRIFALTPIPEETRQAPDGARYPRGGCKPHDAQVRERCDSRSDLRQSIVINSPNCSVVRSLPAATLSCLRAVCNAANASIAAPGAERIENKNREAGDKPTFERTESALSSAGTPIARDAPDWDRCDSDLSSAATVIRGRLTLKATTGHKGVSAVCSVEHRMLTLSIAQRPTWDASGAGRQPAESNSPVLVEVPLEELAVGLKPGLANMFTIATIYENRMYDDDICCFAGDQAERDEWISIFRRMGVPVFDVSEGTGKAKELSL